MYLWLQSALYLVFLVALILSAYYSVRYRRQATEKLRGLYAAKMNISMGVMLMAISAIQLFLFSGFYLRIIFGSVCLLLGLFNLFSGLRSHMHYSR